MPRLLRGCDERTRTAPGRVKGQIKHQAPTHQRSVDISADWAANRMILQGNERKEWQQRCGMDDKALSG
jgi:hypothetical protein